MHLIGEIFANRTGALAEGEGDRVPILDVSTYGCVWKHVPRCCLSTRIVSGEGR